MNMKRSLETLLGRAQKARAQFESAVSNEQQVCEHKTLEECDYLPSHHGSSLPPIRVCCDCGITEEGWGPGYVVLKGKAHGISRDALYGKRQGLMVNDAHKGPLLRREVTVAQLVSRHL